ncbi:MAG TPA: hypothetical protein VI670_28085 [Thermoanaerobaculia bacterium]|jgi:hypothetical protein
MRKLLLVVFALGLASAAFADAVDTSGCDVLANPAAFDGKTIRLKAASAVAGFDEFVIADAACKAAGAIWLSYPEGTKAKAGPAAFVRLQVAKNGPAVADAPKRPAVTLDRNGDFKKFDSLLATPYKSSTACLGCPRYVVTATLVGRLDGVSNAGTPALGFGNLNLYRARLVLQSVSAVEAHEIDYAAAAMPGDSRRAGRAAADQLRRAVEAYGAEGEVNGVEVGFGVANAVPPDDGRKGTGNSPDGILFLTTFDMDRLGKQQLSYAMAHTGTHIADIRGGVTLKGIDDAEARAWQSTFGQ